MNPLANKRILLGVTGGIACYKSAELVRRLRAADAEVQVVMTRAAQAFVGPLTFQALSGRAVSTELLDAGQESAMGHIELARWAEAVVVAPASADFMARLVHGLADDLLATLCLATSAPIILAPAMNRQMWLAPATQENRAGLARQGHVLLGPYEGELACGETGPGRMIEPEVVRRHLERLFAPAHLAGRSVLVTAGPTREAIDPVRYVSNRSSGLMGYAIAEAAVAAGAHVTLVSGPVALEAPPGVERIAVTSAQEMHDAVMERAQDADIFIAAAAVADYRPATYVPGKIKKREQRLALDLERTPDILAEVAGLPRRPFCVGFAAETEALEANARRKLVDKSLDMVAANWVGASGSGIESRENALILYWPGGSLELPLAPKEELAVELVEVIAERYREKSPA
jgi:phosphopantothenoylcysteine decarboxylase/phosphopantothenate--cysteine ligase